MNESLEIHIPIPNDEYYRYRYSENKKDCLGVGGFCPVYKGNKYNLQNERIEVEVAIKVVPHLNINNIKMIEKEVNICKKINHNHAVELYDFIIDSNNKAYLIMELCDSNLNKIISELSEEKIIIYLSQLVEIISFLHSKNIIHRDIKPDNILLKNNVIKLADFGISKQKIRENDKVVSFVGTPSYAAPEIYMEASYDEMVDIFSLGATLYHCYYKKSFVECYGELKYSDRIISNQFKENPDEIFKKPPPNNIVISSLMKNMIQQMLKYDAKKRIKLSDIKEIMKIIKKDKKLLDDPNFINNFRLENLTRRLEMEFENLNLLLDMIMKLIHLLKNDELRGNELIIDNIKKLIFYLAKFHFSISKHVHENLEKKNLQIWYSENIWELLYEQSAEHDYKIQNDRFLNIFENSKKTIEILEKKFKNNNTFVKLLDDDGLNLLINIEKCISAIFKSSSYLFTEYQPTKNVNFSEIYEAFYYLIICLSWKKTLDENFRSIKLNSFGLNLNKEEIRKLIFKRVKQYIDSL